VLISTNAGHCTKKKVQKPTASEKFAPMQPLQVENIHNAVGKTT